MSTKPRPQLEWALNLPEAGALVRDAVRKEAEIIAKIAELDALRVRHLSDLRKTRGSALALAAESWSAEEIHAAQTAWVPR